MKFIQIVKNTVTALTSIVLLVSSCGLYKKYERAEMPFVDSLYRRLNIPASDTISTASVSWDKIFTDPILQEWIRLGLEHNTDLKVAYLKVQESQAYLLAARRALLPGVAFTASGGLSGSFNAQIGASWETDIFGSLRNSKRKAEAALEQSEAYKQAVQTQLVASIANNYYTLLMLDEQLNISKRTLKTWEENIRAMEALKRAGKTNEAAVLQAKANKLSVEASVLTLEKEILAVENSFCALLGTVPMSINRSNIAEQKLPQELFAGVPAELLSRRPDVRQAEMALAQCFYNTNIAKAAFYPALSLSGAIGWTTGAGAIVLDPGSLIANLIASIAQPIFNRGAIKAKKLAAESQYKQAIYQFRQSLLDAGVEVNNAISMWQTAKKRVEIDKKQIVSLQAAVWNTQLLMKHGNANYLEVLTAQKNLLQVELAEVSDRFDEFQSVINLYHALGGGY
ncbi:MAG: efflux transporter outer membrane subunit [Bacteroidales bacterium]|nr:efflux transporter outer membrane subunit [Bacteroidales bacterium]